MGCDIFLTLPKVVGWQGTFYIDALPDSSISRFDQFIPKFILSYKDQCHRIHGIHMVIQQETDFFQRFTF